MLASEFTREIEYSLGVHPNQSGGSYNRALFVLNLAGEWLVSTKSGGWRFLSGAEATVDIDVYGQGDLPEDFKTLTSICSTTGTGLYMTDVDFVRTQNRGVAVEWAMRDGVLRPVLAGPKDSPMSVGIVYERKWRTLTSSNDAIYMPEFMRPLLLEVCRQYAANLEGLNGVNPDTTKLEGVKSSQLYRDMAEMDGSAQHEMGLYFGEVYTGGHPAATPVPVIPPPS